MLKMPFFHSWSKFTMFQFMTVVVHPRNTHFSEVPDLPVGMGRILLDPQSNFFSSKSSLSSLSFSPKSCTPAMTTTAFDVF